MNNEYTHKINVANNAEYATRANFLLILYKLAIIIISTKLASANKYNQCIIIVVDNANLITSQFYHIRIPQFDLILKIIIKKKKNNYYKKS